MPHDQNNDSNNKHEYGNTVDAVHHFQVNITFGVRLAFAEDVDI